MHRNECMNVITTTILFEIFVEIAKENQDDEYFKYIWPNFCEHNNLPEHFSSH